MAGINRNKILKNIEKALRSGKYLVAIDEYKKLLSANPKDFMVKNRIGELYEKAGNYKEAFTYYRSIAEHYAKSGFTTKSIAIYVKMYKIDPKNTEVAFTLANLYHKVGYDVEARKIYIDLAEYLNTQKRFGDVLNVYQKLAELDYDNTDILLKLAELYEKQGNNKEAGDIFRKIGDIFRRNKNIDKAIFYYKEGFSKIANLYTLNSLINILKENDRVSEVIGLLQKVIEEHPEDRSFKKVLAKIYLEKEDYDNAESTLLEIAESGDEIDEELYETLAKIYVEKGDLTKAFQVIEPVIDQLVELNKGNKSQELLNIILMKDSSFLPALWKKANIFKRLEQKSSYSLTLLSLAEVYKKKEDFDRVRKIYEELVQLEPSNETYRFELERIDKLETGEKIVTDSPDEENIKEEETIVKNINQFEKIFDGGFKEEAIREVETISSLYPNNPRIKEKLLDFYLRAEYYEKALRITKELIDIYEKLGQKDKVDTVVREMVPHFPDDPIISSYITSSKTELNIPSADEGISDDSFTDDDKSIAEYISQIKFFIKENFAEDAIKLIEKAMTSYPNNPELVKLQQSAKLLLNTKIVKPDTNETIETYEEDTAELYVVDENQDNELEIESNKDKEDNIEDEMEVEMELELDDVTVEEDTYDKEKQMIEQELLDEKEEDLAHTEPNKKQKKSNIRDEELDHIASEIIKSIDNEKPDKKNNKALKNNITQQEIINFEEEQNIEEDDIILEEENTETPLDLDENDDFKNLNLGISEEGIDEALNLALTETEEEEESNDETDSGFESLKLEQEPFENVDDLFEGEEVFDMPESYYFEVGTIVSQEVKAINDITNRAKHNVTSTMEKDFDDILDQFKKQLDVTVKKEDFDTRYNLGIAYYGMGLYDEAINEFLISSKDDKLKFDSFVHLGYSFFKKGLFKEAEEWFNKVLSIEETSEDKIVSIKYELANIYTINGKNNEAIKLYKEILEVDSNYRDVKNRLKKLLY
jgi:tetratricopeptide (TPR) repeat protein